MPFWYLATPYSKYPDGLEAAFRAACEQTALLIRAGVPVFSPIAHTHPVAMAGNMDPLDHSIWLPADEPMMKAAHGLIVCKLPSWERSYGIECERIAFEGAHKPVIYMEPGVIPILPEVGEQ